MRRFLFTMIACLMPALSVLATDYPVDAGASMITGTLSLRNSSGELQEDRGGNSITTFNVVANGVAFITANLGMGGSITFDVRSEGDTTISNGGIGPMLAYYFGGPESKVYPFVNAGIRFVEESETITERDEQSGEEEDKTSTNPGYQFFVGVGATFMISSHLAAVGEVSFTIHRRKVGRRDYITGKLVDLRMGLAGFIF